MHSQLKYLCVLQRFDYVVHTYQGLESPLHLCMRTPTIPRLDCSNYLDVHFIATTQAWEIYCGILAFFEMWPTLCCLCSQFVTNIQLAIRTYCIVDQIWYNYMYMYTFPLYSTLGFPGTCPSWGTSLEAWEGSMNMYSHHMTLVCPTLALWPSRWHWVYGL